VTLKVKFIRIYSHRNILTLVRGDIGQTVFSLNIILLHITWKLRQIEKHFLLLTANFQLMEVSHSYCFSNYLTFKTIYVIMFTSVAILDFNMANNGYSK